jgi:hypothetical protein
MLLYYSDIMLTEERPTSSFYSDCFELEDLVNKLCDEADAQDLYAIETLQNERHILYHELENKRIIWNRIYQVLIESADIAAKINALCKFAQENIRKEQNKWLANRNSI